MYPLTQQLLPLPKICPLQTQQEIATLDTTAQAVLTLQRKIWQHRATMCLLLVKVDKPHVLLELTIHSTPKLDAQPVPPAITAQPLQ